MPLVSDFRSSALPCTCLKIHHWPQIPTSQDLFFKYIHRYMYVCRFISRNWLTQLWRLASQRCAGQPDRLKVSQARADVAVTRHQFFFSGKLIFALKSFQLFRLILPTLWRVIFTQSQQIEDVHYIDKVPS